MDGSRLSHPLCSTLARVSRMGRVGSQVGSSVMIVTGPLSLALAILDVGPPVGVGVGDGELPESFPTTNTVMTTVTAITASTAIPPKIHLPLPPPLGGGPGGGPHCGAPPD